jgi:hypothetical protein
MRRLLIPTAALEFDFVSCRRRGKDGVGAPMPQRYVDAMSASIDAYDLNTSE